MESWPSLIAMFFSQAEKYDEKPFLWGKKNDAYQALSWRKAAEMVSSMALGLRDLGISNGETVVLCSENRPEWPIFHLAVMAAGGITVPAYTTNTVNDHLHILENSGAKGAFVSTRQLSENLINAARQTDGVNFLISIDELDISQASGPDILRWDDLVAKHVEKPVVATDWTVGVNLDSTAVVIYTSGTGGAPKGVMLSHKAILHNCQGAYDVIQELGLDDEVFLSFLPLSHSYEYTAGQMFPMFIGAQIYYSEGIEHLSSNMAEAKPTIMTAVPRLYELMHSKIIKGVKKAGGLKENLFMKAVDLGKRNFLTPGSLSLGEKITNVIVDKLVRDKVRGNFGGRLKVLVSGGAPLNEDIGLFFTALGLNLLQGYGQTESAPVISVNRPKLKKMKTVGPPLLDTEVKIAEDGEILVRGDLVMQGYWRNPEATAEVIKDGWLHTGDVGHFDEDNYIEITDRKKDIIVNSGGDNLSPQRVEGIMILEPEIAQAMVYGDSKPHLVSLIVPDQEFTKEWAEESGKANNLPDLIENNDFRSAVSAALDRVNEHLSVIERVRRFILVAEEFSVENEMMTPTLKVRRHKIIEVYGDQLEALYRS